MGKRVWQYPEATGITNDDVILIDSPTGGSRSIKANEIGSVLINKTLTERGTFDAADDNVDGYKKVIVDVPYTDVEVASGPVASWDDGEDLPLKSLTCFIEPVQSGSGDPSPENVRPISGWDEGNVIVCGNNLLASSTLVSNTYINQNTGEEIPYNGWTSTDYIPINTNKWYRLLKLVDGSYEVNAGATVYWACYDSNLNFVRGSVGDGMKDFPSNAKWLRTSSQTALMNKAVLCEDSDVSSFTTESDYIDGTAYTVEFKDGDNPLTVYGGTLDVVSGELKVVPYYASYNGETLEGEWISDRDVYAVGTTPTIGAQVVNIDATPQTYQLTPTQVKSLVGENNIYSNTGDVDVEYQKIWVRPSA